MNTATITRHGILYNRSIINRQLRLELIAKVNNICQMCKRQFTTEELQIDHIYPVYKGGHDTIENYQVLCYKCNIQKIWLDKTLPQKPIQAILELKVESQAINIIKCLRCDHEWASRNLHPIRCAKCKTPYWNIPKKVSHV